MEEFGQLMMKKEKKDMEKKIEIKPNDQFYVGKKIRWSCWGESVYFIPRLIGDSQMIGDEYVGDKLDNSGENYKISNNPHQYWVLYEDKDEKIKNLEASEVFLLHKISELQTKNTENYNKYEKETAKRTALINTAKKCLEFYADINFYYSWKMESDKGYSARSTLEEIKNYEKEFYEN